MAPRYTGRTLLTLPGFGGEERKQTTDASPPRDPGAPPPSTLTYPSIWTVKQIASNNESLRAIARAISVPSQMLFYIMTPGGVGTRKNDDFSTVGTVTQCPVRVT